MSVNNSKLGQYKNSVINNNSMLVKRKTTNVARRKLGPNRQMSIIKMVDSLDNDDDDNKETF